MIDAVEFFLAYIVKEATKEQCMKHHMTEEERLTRARELWKKLDHGERERLMVGVLLEIADEHGPNEVVKGEHTEHAFEEEFGDLPKKVRGILTQAVEETGFRGDLFMDLPDS